MRTVFAVLSLVASTLAYQVTSPGTNQNWTTSGTHIVSWSRVDTDALNFTMLLVNQNKAILPSGSEVLSAFVDGTKGTLQVAPPSAGFPVGDGFQINLVAGPDQTNTILAQSGQFSILQSASSSSSSLNSATVSTLTSIVTPTVSAGSSGTGTDTGDLNPTSITNTTATTNGATRLANGGVMILLAALGAVLA